MLATMPAGLRSFDPMPYGYVRWNGKVWANTWIDHYNKQLARIEAMHTAGYDTQDLIEGLYYSATGWDAL